MSYLTGSRSSFPQQIDQILELFDLPASQKANAQRYQHLKTKETLSSLEQTELNNLTVLLQDYIIDPWKFNLFGDIVVNMQKFFKEGVEPFVDTLKTNALNEIENKKGEIIDYMDSTQAGAIRNDIGIINNLTTTNKTNLVNAINEVNAKEVDLMPIENKIAILNGIYSTSGTNTYTMTVPSLTILNIGQKITVKFTNANTGSSTLNINNLGAKPILKSNSVAIASGDIKANSIHTMVYDGSNFQLQSQVLNKQDINLGNVDNEKQMPIVGGTFTGIAKAHPNTSYTVAQIRNIILSPNDANVSAMNNGDIWIKYK